MTYNIKDIAAGVAQRIPGWASGAVPDYLIDGYNKQLVEWVRALKKEAGHVSIGRRKRNLRALAIARNEVARTVRVLSAKEEGPFGPLACRAGCSHCCYYNVSVNSAEADILADIVREMPEEQRTKMQEKLRVAKEVAELEPDPTMLRHPCPFLGEGNMCSVYENRPLSCRSYVSTNVAICERGRYQRMMHAGEGGISNDDLLRNVNYLGMLTPITDAVYDIAGSSYSLAQAVLDRLNDPKRPQ